MLRHTLRSVGLVLLFALAAARRPNAESGPTWLDRLNFYRATASLPPVVEDPRLSGGVLQHARYMVMHDVVKHSENQRDSGATPEGAAAAAVSNLAGSTRLAEPDYWAVDMWMQAPFHALGILDPALMQVGFGIHHAQTGRIQTAAGLDVIRGRSAAAPNASYPIVWPADGASVPIAAHVSEYPSPLTSCPGYSAPAGLPLIVQLGSGGEAPRVTRSWIFEEERALEHCVFDEGTYRNGDAAQQRLGRSILASRNAIVLVPRRPLRSGAGYRAVVEVNGRVIDWTFRISGGS
jgi:cysteine-rich secretory family protein